VSGPSPPVSASVGADVSATVQKPPTSIALPPGATVAPGGSASSVHLSSSSLSIQLKPITPRTPVIHIRQDAPGTCLLN